MENKEGMPEEVKGLYHKYFVMNPNKRDIYGIASRIAILVYGHIIQHQNKKLTDDLTYWITSIPEKDDIYEQLGYILSTMWALYYAANPGRSGNGTSVDALYRWLDRESKS